MAYCSRSDLLLGGLPTPAYMDIDKVIQQAADEIDVSIGQRYATPISLSEADAIQRPGALLLKIINANLATGKIFLQAAAASEDRTLHQYGLSLVQQASCAVDRIRTGEQDLEGAVLREAKTVLRPAPRVVNGDPFSQVEDFYSSFGYSRPYYPPEVLMPGVMVDVEPVGIVAPLAVVEPPPVITQEEFQQTNPATTWNFDHNLGHVPVSVDVIMFSGDIMPPDMYVVQSTSSHITVSFGLAYSGTLRVA